MKERDLLGYVLFVTFLAQLLTGPPVYVPPPFIGAKEPVQDHYRQTNERTGHLLKQIKRHDYGRARPDLLRARRICPA